MEEGLNSLDTDSIIATFSDEIVGSPWKSPTLALVFGGSLKVRK